MTTWSTKITHCLAYGFGLGKLPKAPGTFGSLAAFPIFFLIRPLPWTGYLSVVVGLSLVGIWICGKTARDMGEHDHPSIVWDEICGMLLTLMFVPGGLLNYAIAFGFFRLFDITKPPPIRWCDQQVAGGFGIMLDDILAGIYGGLASWAFIRLLSETLAWLK